MSVCWKVSKMRIGDATAIKTWARDSVITPVRLDLNGVHNGKHLLMYLLLKTWLAITWVSLVQHANLLSTAVRWRKIRLR